QDEDSAYIGMNRSKSDVIDIYFENRQLNKVKFINDVNGTMYPLRQIPQEQKTLRGFLWQDNRRPKNKLELFE
ncbi:MAG: OstA family protein, partial [Ferruginibacter sp.]|nr:OstA family protein [Ferruginibacter sp.]